MRKSPIKFKDVIGNKYNYLTLIGEGIYRILKNGDKQRLWLFKCDCGIEKLILPNNVFSGSIKSCGCKKKEVCIKAIKEYYTNKYITPVEDKLYGSYISNSKEFNREFSLTKEKFIELVNSNCYYCGTKPFLVRGNKTKSVIKALNGIDRIDSSKGYLDSNVVPCCIHCNRAKMDRPLEDFKKWIKLIYNNLYEHEQGRN